MKRMKVEQWVKINVLDFLKCAKEEEAKKKSNSTMVVVTQTKRSRNNYVSLLHQLDAMRFKTKRVSPTPEARYISGTSFRNIVIHIMAVAVSHYRIGRPDPRLKSINKSIFGARKLYKLIQTENIGL